MEETIDRLRQDTMSDAEVIAVAANVIRQHFRVQNHSQDAFNLLADRLEQVKLREEEQ